MPGGMPGFNFRTSGGPGTSFRFTPSQADDIFSQFFGGRNPFGGNMGGRTRGPASASSGMPPGFSFFGEGPTSDEDDEMDLRGFNTSGHRKAPSIKRQFNCTLEELYKGVVKKMKVTKNIADPSGKSMQVEKILNINVKPGWKDGTKITFEREGDERPGEEPADLIFVLKEQTHTRFTRQGNDLSYTASISLKQALTNPVIEILTLDDRKLRITMPDVVTPNSKQVIRGEGMPLQKDPTQKGDLVITFNIRFPSSLSTQQKAAIANALPE